MQEFLAIITVIACVYALYLASQDNRKHQQKKVTPFYPAPLTETKPTGTITKPVKRKARTEPHPRVVEILREYGVSSAVAKRLAENKVGSVEQQVRSCLQEWLNNETR